MRVSLILILILTGCTTAPIKLTDTRGRTAQCGPYLKSGLHAFTVADRESRCLDDYRAQGYVRQP